MVEFARGETLTTGKVSGLWWLKPVFDWLAQGVVQGAQLVPLDGGGWGWVVKGFG